MIIELIFLFIFVAYILFFVIVINAHETYTSREQQVSEFSQELIEFENIFNQNNCNSDGMFQGKSRDMARDPDFMSGQEEMPNKKEEFKARGILDCV